MKFAAFFRQFLTSPILWHTFQSLTYFGIILLNQKYLIYFLVFVAAIFTVMCYNVLCDKYCTRQMYGYCPTWALNWEYRKKGIIEEIRHGAADIISLQVRESVPVSQILSSNYRWGNQQISQFIGEKSAHLSQSLSLIDRENIISCISNIVFGQITEFMGWKVLLHKKAQGFKEVSIRPLIWVYDITETVLCTMDGVGEKPSRLFTSVKQDWHQLKVNQNKAKVW